MSNGCNTSDDWEVISVYTRKQAIDDGVLVDVSEMAKEAGFRYPVAVTRAGVWHNCVAVPEAVRSWQSEEGRLWDILWMLRCQIGQSQCGEELRFTVLVDNGEGPKPVELNSHCGPNDDLTPCITILAADED